MRPTLPTLACVCHALLASACVTPAPRAQVAPVLEPPRADERYLEVPGAFLRVREQGPASPEGLPVVLVHGYGSRLEIWDAVQQELSATRRVIALDQRGFGLSERPPGSYGPAVHAADVIALLDALGIERALLVGHSYGGGVVARVALLAPERVAGIALVDAFLLDRQMNPSFRWAKVPLLGELLFGAFYREVPGEKYLLAFHDDARFVTVEALREQQALMARPGSVYAALETVRGMDYRDVEAGYRGLGLPTLLVWGENDRVTPLRDGKALAALFDHAEFSVLPACGHVPSWERPAGLLAALRPFVARVESARRAEPTAGGTP